MKNLKLFVIAAWATGVVGCAAPTGSNLSPKVSSVVECDEVQKKVLGFDRQDQSQLIRSIVVASLDLKATPAASLENCLATGLRIDCDSRWCRIFEKYFAGNEKN